MLEEFKRRHAVGRLRKELIPLVEEWWWARDETLSEVGRNLRCNHCVIDGFLEKSR